MGEEKIYKVVSKDKVNGVLWEAAEKLAKMRYFPVEEREIEMIYNCLDNEKLDDYLGWPDYSYN